MKPTSLVNPRDLVSSSLVGSSHDSIQFLDAVETEDRNRYTKGFNEKAYWSK